MTASCAVGRLAAESIVNGKPAGVIDDLPVTPSNRHLFLTEPMPWVNSRWLRWRCRVRGSRRFWTASSGLGCHAVGATR